MVRFLASLWRRLLGRDVKTKMDSSVYNSTLRAAKQQLISKAGEIELGIRRLQEQRDALVIRLQSLEEQYAGTVRGDVKQDLLQEIANVERQANAYRTELNLLDSFRRPIRSTISDLEALLITSVTPSEALLASLAQFVDAIGSTDVPTPELLDLIAQHKTEIRHLIIELGIAREEIDETDRLINQENASELEDVRARLESRLAGPNSETEKPRDERSPTTVQEVNEPAEEPELLEE